MEASAQSQDGSEAGQTATDLTGKAQVGVSSVLFYFVRGRVGSIAHAHAREMVRPEPDAPRYDLNAVSRRLPRTGRAGRKV